jgi:hypothetical protein
MCKCRGGIQDTMSELAFPSNAGCAGARDGGPHVCIREPFVTVKHEVTGARPRVVRVFVCEAHAVGHPDPRPLTADDRAELRRRRARVRPTGFVADR